MRQLLLLSIVILVSGCSCVGCNPWANMDYTLAECGTKEAILTTTGCQTNPATTTQAGQVAAVSNPNDVGASHNDVHTHENHAMQR